jgi:hypothetical protein
MFSLILSALFLSISFKGTPCVEFVAMFAMSCQVLNLVLILFQEGES